MGGPARQPPVERLPLRLTGGGCRRPGVPHPRLRWPAPWRPAPLIVQWYEARAHFFRKELRLFPGREVPAFWEPVVMNELGERILCPTPRGLVELVWKGAHSNRHGDALRGEERKLVFPVKTSRRDRRGRQPVEGDVVEDVVTREAFSFSIEYARDERVTARVV